MQKKTIQEVVKNNLERAVFTEVLLEQVVTNHPWLLCTPDEIGKSGVTSHDFMDACAYLSAIVRKISDAGYEGYQDAARARTKDK